MAEPTKGAGDNREFTKKAIKKYLEDSAACPFCRKAEGIESSGKQESESDWISVMVHCTACKKSWWEIYTLSSIDTVRH
jgi:hypothetical protein